MKLKVIAILLVVAAGLAAKEPNGKSISKESLFYFGPDLKKIYPGYAGVKYEQDFVFSINDAKGKKLGTLHVETIADEDREYGYSGTIELGLVIGTDGKIDGMVVGKNVESKAYLGRVKRKLSDHWNDLELKDVPEHKVDAVTGATHSSGAIIVGVKRLARNHLGSDTPIIISKPEAARKRPGNDAAAAKAELNVKIEQQVLKYRQQPSDEAKAELRNLLDRQATNEIAEFTGRATMLNRIVTISDKLLIQWTERKEEELDMRMVAALEGRQAAMKFGKDKNMIYFVHPGRENATRDEEMANAVKAYKENPDEEHKKKLRELIREQLDMQLEGMPEHNSDQEKAYIGTKAYLEKLTANKEQIVERRLNSLLHQYKK